jgi:hypothetical protein
LTAAEITEGISALNAAIASGELKVSYAGRTVEYRNVPELIAAKADLRSELSRIENDGVRRSRVINVVPNV